MYFALLKIFFFFKKESNAVQHPYSLMAPPTLSHVCNYYSLRVE